MNIKFRRMRAREIPEIFEIEKNLFNDVWSKSSFLFEIKNKFFSYPFVLYLNEVILGYCVCWYYRHELHIGNFAVKKEYQRNGYGQLLMENIFKQFPDYKQAFLEVNVTNNAAINLYIKNGFSIISTRKSYYANGEDALVMVKYN